MPPGKGSQDVHISLRDDLVERLTILASKPGMTRSKVMEAALIQHLEQGASETLLAGLHQRFDSMTTQTTQAIAELMQAVHAMHVTVQGLKDRTDKMEQRYQSFIEAVKSLYDHEKAERNGQAKQGLLHRLIGGSH